MAAGKYKTDQNYDDDIDFIKDSDAVQGDPAETDPDDAPLTGPINVVIQKIVGSLAYLKNAIDNASIARMTDSVFGTGRTATQQEAEDGTAHGIGGPLLSPLRGKQAIDRHALNLLRSALAAANTTRRGTVQRATQTQATGLTDTERYLTAALVNSILQHANAQATASRRGTVQRAQSSTPNNNDVLYTTKAIVRAMIEALATVPDATTTVKGKAELSTQEEVDAGIANDTIVTPETLHGFFLTDPVSITITATISERVNVYNSVNIETSEVFQSAHVTYGYLVLRATAQQAGAVSGKITVQGGDGFQNLFLHRMEPFDTFNISQGRRRIVTRISSSGTNPITWTFDESDFSYSFTDDAVTAGATIRVLIWFIGILN